MQQLPRADHRLHPVLQLGNHQLVQLLDQRLGPARLAEAALEHTAGDLGRGADQLALVGGREVEAAPLEEILLGPGPDRLGVEQQPVVVEDDRPGRGGGSVAHLRQPPNPRPLGGCYLPLHFGVRLPRKAAMPSFASSLAKAVAKARFSASMPSSRSPLWEALLICSRATGAWPASLPAHISAVSNSSWSGTTRLTRPESSASPASTASPTRFISRALLGPTRRGRRWVPPKPGTIPSLISGWPKTAASAAIRTSQAIASSQPPPKAIELTAAIVAVLSVPNSRSSAWAVCSNSSPPPSSIWVKALMSAPAEKTTGIEEATTIAPISSEALTRSQTLPRSRITSGEIAFIGTLASQAIATSPRVSSLTVSACSPSSACG